MEKKIAILLILIAMVSSLLFADDTVIMDLKKSCVAAAQRGIELDIQQTKENIKYLQEHPIGNPPDSLPKTLTWLEELEGELKKYKSINLSDYKLPEKREIVGWIKEPCRTSISFEGKSRSGPFYDIAGIKGNDFSVLKPDRSGYPDTPKIKYKMSIYLVYRRKNGPLGGSYYVYVDSYEVSPVPK